MPDRFSELIPASKQSNPHSLFFHFNRSGESISTPDLGRANSGSGIDMCDLRFDPIPWHLRPLLLPLSAAILRETNE